MGALQKMKGTGSNQRMEVKLFNQLVDRVNELSTDSNKAGDSLSYDERTGVIGGSHEVVTGSDDSKKVRMTGTIRYQIDGVEYAQTVVEGVFSDTGQVDTSKFGAWRILMGKTGAITTQSATAAGTGAQAHVTAEQALVSLAQLAITADTVEIGYLMIEASGGNPFVPNTDNPTSGHANVTTSTYYAVHIPRLDNGFTAEPSVGLSEGDSGNEDEYAYGTINVRTNGLNIAQIGANLNHPFTQADTITTAIQFGAHLIITDTAGSAIISLPASGILGNATAAMTYSTADLATTALDAAQAALPLIFTVIGRIVVDSLKASFAYNTDKIDGTAANGTGTFTDEDSGEYDRTDISGTGVGIDVPTIPATQSTTAPSMSGL